MKNKFIVEWEDGTFTVETAADAEEFKSKFLKPRLQKIKHAEYDRVIKIESTPSVAATSLPTDSWGQNMIGAPNLWSQGIRGQGVVVAVVRVRGVDRDHQAGDELLYDYQYERSDDHTEEDEKFYACRCGSPKCRGSILAPKTTKKK